jgi:hypothetical protein
VFLYFYFLQFSSGEAAIFTVFEKASLNTCILKFIRRVPEGDQWFCMSQSVSFPVNVNIMLFKTLTLADFYILCCFS